jgi:hypothetical protein
MRSALVLVVAIAACQSSNVSRDLGARCDGLADCNQACLSGEPWPGGFCTTLCDDDLGCPDDAACVEEQGGVCEFRCMGDTDCVFLGVGYACTLIDDHGGGLKVMVCRGD